MNKRVARILMAGAFLAAVIAAGCSGYGNGGGYSTGGGVMGYPTPTPHPTASHM